VEEPERISRKAQGLGLPRRGRNNPNGDEQTDMRFIEKSVIREDSVNVSCKSESTEYEGGETSVQNVSEGFIITSVRLRILILYEKDESYPCYRNLVENDFKVAGDGDRGGLWNFLDVPKAIDNSHWL